MNRRAIAGGLAALALLAVPPAAVAQGADEAPPPGDERGVPAPAPSPDAAPARVRVALKGVKGKNVDVGRRISGVGYVRPFVPGQKAEVWVSRAAKVIHKRTLAIRKVRGKDQGRFKIRSKPLIRDGAYRVRARKAWSPEQKGFAAESRKVGVSYPDLDPGDRSNEVKLFNKLLSKQAYFTGSGHSYASATERAVLAYRKVNRMPRTTNATPGIFADLARGKGGFKLQHPGAGKHVEADLSRQVMVLARDGEAQHIFHISSGKASTPTIRGKHTFFRKQYGRNSVGMVHSVYFGPTNKGYATHGYPSVPTYPASSGCLRNPIPNSLFIYNWIDLGDTIYVYG